MRVPSPLLLPLPLLLLPLLGAPAPARAAAGFDGLQARAQRVDSLQVFLGEYVGECRDPFEKVACEKNAARARQGLKGRLHYVRLYDRHSRLLQVAGEAPDGSLEVLLTPIFDADGYGLTQGRPVGLDGAGNPRIRLLPFRTRLPAGMSRRSFELAMRTGNLLLELVFVPGEVWRLKGSGSDAQGVAAQFKALRLTSARSGQVVSEVLF